VTVAIGKYPADIVFLDPPYPLEREYRATLEQLGESAPPLVIVQHSARFQLAEQWGKLKRTRSLKQGDNALSFFEAE
jgi:16S rRNA (guanine966-N2)-methyltransferase